MDKIISSTAFIIPFCLTFYLYLMPWVLVRKYIEKHIELTFDKYCKEFEDITYIKSNIYEVIGFISFLSAYGSIIISVLTDTGFNWDLQFKLFGIGFLILFIFIIIKYLTCSLKISKCLKILELLTLIFGIFLIGVNIYSRS